ncbi:50S ribosomal protein L13 [Hugenholtzia roseola]|uniref:50S ribosomal protein L13 n=1 Tax=Hugenholtzia roseola TaxID=1002 RepID=UPI00047DA8C4|nr:50S ribosomal protein L13 [Hugenholtzia roseola]
MDALSYKTQMVAKQDAPSEWIVIDAEGMVLGRLASEVAKRLRGKHKPSYTPHTECGDNVIVINADKIRMTGNKWDDKELISHTGYPGGQRVTTPRKLMEKFPTRLVERAVKGMLPHNRLGRALYRNLHVYAGGEHKHQAQQPKTITL